MAGKYDKAIDRESAFEMLSNRADAAATAAAKAEAAEAKAGTKKRKFEKARRYDAAQSGRSTSQRRSSTQNQGFGGAIASVVIKELKGATGRRIVRGLFKGRLTSRAATWFKIRIKLFVKKKLDRRSQGAAGLSACVIIEQRCGVFCRTVAGLQWSDL